MIDLSKQRLERYHRGELSFDLIDSGPLEGEAVVLLHGFPETAQCWDQVRVQLNAAGFVPLHRTSVAIALMHALKDVRLIGCRSYFKIWIC